jgi:hypothetical protein
MLRKTDDWLVKYAQRRSVRSRVRRVVGFAVVIGGYVVIAVYLLRCAAIAR